MKTLKATILLLMSALLMGFVTNISPQQYLAEKVKNLTVDQPREKGINEAQVETYFSQMNNYDSEDQSDVVLESVVVRGTIKKHGDNKPVNNATVEVYPLFGDRMLTQTTADAQGNYELQFSLPDDLLYPGKFRVETVAQGFEQTPTLLKADSSVIESLDIELREASFSGDSITISSLNDLRKIGETAEYPLDGTYVLTQNLDASESAQWNKGRGFDPIGEEGGEGSAENFFRGTFDARGHAISNLTINRPDTDELGFFAGLAEGGTVQNLTLKGISVTGERRVGGLVGISQSNAVIENCRVEGTVDGWRDVGMVAGVAHYVNISSTDVEGTVGPAKERTADEKYTGSFSPAQGAFVGGLVGVAGHSLIQDVTSTVDVLPGHVLEGVGGIAGHASLNTKIRHADARGSLKLYWDDQSSYDGLAVGGLVGDNEGSIYASSASVSIQGQKIGGLVGNNSRGIIEKSFASGDMEARNGQAGGLVGMDIAGTIRSSYATGNVSGKSSIGGLVGESRGVTIQSSFAVGTISAEEPETAGALLGDNSGDASFEECYWDRATTGQEEPVGKEFGSENSTDSSTRRLTTEEMTGEQARENMKGLDFDTVWQIVSGDYPVLREVAP